ncbi:N-acetylmuramoyl-L-alanine amidase [Terracoccus luteus]|jgi:hypothetical protein|uniref:N-acetylmuramoyl-L-alanine amidase n=1 Tax=Terracoccus luteus TaxID=53356 RepID=A0A495XXS3_9MICO|nr:N-acetylmuramoyl-L-alanine amidase [Terracoccus luteus]RKT77303.1 N-acetylmuramoyl-L-alanine amidase [Terracoccus luteus]
MSTLTAAASARPPRDRPVRRRVVTAGLALACALVPVQTGAARADTAADGPALTSAAAAVGAGTDVAGTSTPPGGRATKPRITTIPITATAPSGAKGAAPSAAGPVAQVTRQRTSFDVAGVTSSGAALDGIRIEVQTHGAAGWSPWTGLEAEGDGPDPGTPEAAGARVGTAPLLAAGSDGIRLRVFSPDGTLPGGLGLSLVDGGDAPQDARPPRSAAPLSVTAPRLRTVADGATAAGPTSRAASAVTSGVSAPAIVSRSGWGADESLRDCVPTALGGFKAAAVHHTVNSNSYTSTQSASLVRGILAYHTKSLGWCDIGYNFLVDRFGTIFEGRYGSLAGFVQAAHAGGFNRETFGVSVIGDFTRSSFPSAAVSAVSRVIAWQADRSGFDPGAGVTLTSEGSTRYPAGTRVVLPRVVGHRNLSLTSCPGDTAYPQVAGIRSSAASTWRAGQYRAAPGLYTPLTARRVVDTRTGLGGSTTALGPDSSRVITIPGLPSTATAVTISVTASGATGGTYLVVHPDGTPLPTSSLLSTSPGRTVAAPITVGLGPSARLRVYNRLSTVHITVDVQGYYSSSGGAGFTGVAPRRVLDTRTGTGAPRAQVPARGSVTFAVPGLPSTARSVVLNISGANARASTAVTAHPVGTARPGTPNLHLSAARLSTTSVVVPVGSDRRVTLYSDLAATDLVADVVGYHATGLGARFTATAPRRVADTRWGWNIRLGPVTSGLVVGTYLPAPSTANGVAMNVTAIYATAPTLVTVYPAAQTRPTSPSLTPSANETVSTALLLSTGVGPHVSYSSTAGAVHLLTDVTGYFGP